VAGHPDRSAVPLLQESRLNKTYYIDFDTKDRPGVIMSTTVVLNREMVTDMHAPMSIDLCNHPLYPHLVAYVKANPAR